MPAKSTKLAPTRLPPLPRLRVRRPNKTEMNPCMGIMTSVLGMCYLSAAADVFNALTALPVAGCWASSGYSPQGCAAIEQQLRACMDTPVCFESARDCWGIWVKTIEGACHGYRLRLLMFVMDAETEWAEKECDQLPSHEAVSQDYRSA